MAPYFTVIPGFMAQGGGFDTKFQQKTTHAPVKNEADNGLKNKRGTLAMADPNDPQSATAQFFINYKDNSFWIIQAQHHKAGVMQFLVKS